MDELSRRRAAATHVIVDSDVLDAHSAFVVDDATAHHVFRVLRLREGESVTVTDGAGRWRPTVVVGRDTLEPDGPVEHEDPHDPPITIGAAIPKGDRIDVLVQKVTEIGADRVVLLHADRSIVRWEDDRARRNVARLQRIADEACRQSRRVWRLTVDGPVESSAILPRAVIAEPGCRDLTLRDGFVAIGPEGGWTDRELSLAFDSVGLGPGILRTETAAIVATTLCVALHH
jgi:16S rRNA (uracil1498-N3)-methyltransferase